MSRENLGGGQSRRVGKLQGLLLRGLNFRHAFGQGAGHPIEPIVLTPDPFLTRPHSWCARRISSCQPHLPGLKLFIRAIGCDAHRALRSMRAFTRRQQRVVRSQITRTTGMNLSTLQHGIEHVSASTTCSLARAVPSSGETSCPLDVTRLGGYSSLAFAAVWSTKLARRCEASWHFALFLSLFSPRLPQPRR